MDKLWEKIEKKLRRNIKESLSIYFDRNIPQWMKTKRTLKKEIKRRFIEAMKEEMKKQIKEEEDLILYGDPDSSNEPIGIIDIRTDELKADQIYDVEGKLSKLLNKENTTDGQEKTRHKDGKS